MSNIIMVRLGRSRLYCATLTGSSTCLPWSFNLLEILYFFKTEKQRCRIFQWDPERETAHRDNLTRHEIKAENSGGA
jgi:hypothetical protein